MRALSLMHAASGPSLLSPLPLSAPYVRSSPVLSLAPPPAAAPPHPTPLSRVGRSPIGEIAIVDTDFGTHLIKVLERSDKFDPKKTKTDGGYSL